MTGPVDPGGSDPTIDPGRLGLGHVFAATAETVLVVDVVSGHVVVWNEAAADLLGYPLADAVQLAFDGLVAPEDRRLAHDLVDGIADPASRGPQHALSDLTFLDRDGGRHRVEVSASLAHPDDHPGRYAVLIGRDISERVALDLALRRAAGELAATVGALDQGVVLLSPDLDVRVYNDAARRMLGYDADELVAMVRDGRWETFREDGSVLPRAERPIWRAFARGETVSGALVRWGRKIGETILLRVTTRLVEDDGTVIGLVIAFADATSERVAALASAEHAAEVEERNADLHDRVMARDRILGTVAHDIRNPLTTILGFADLLRRHGESVDLEARLAALDAIERQARVLESLAADLLTVAATDAGATETRRQVVELAETLERIVADSPVAADTRLVVEPGAQAYVDPVHLEQMVTNLLTNADRYGEPPVRLEVSTDEEAAVISVEDGGPGVAAEFVDDLFDRFPTAHRSRARGERGTGLGLSIVHDLARAHQGTVRYEPCADGGARFVVRLPRRPTPERAAPTTPTTAAVPDAQVLVVDDDIDLLGMLRAQFELAGLEVVTATSVDDALELSRDLGLGVVVTDVNLAGSRTGLDLLRQLRSDAATAQLPVIVLTGSSTTGGDAVRAIDDGATDFLRKPVDPRELVARVKAALEASARTRDLTQLTRSLDRATRTDALTGLLNRRGLEAEFDRVSGWARAGDLSVGMLMIDIDHFKSINDDFGHDAGDQALREVAEIIRGELRAEDAVGRWGGEEFLVVLPGADRRRATAVAERIRSAVEDHRVEIDGSRAVVTVSVGVAARPNHELLAAVAAADDGVYAAKQSGRNRVRWAPASMTDRLPSEG